MEKTFHYSTKHNNFKPKATGRCNECKSDHQSEPKEICRSGDLAVVPSNLQAKSHRQVHPYDLTRPKQKRILQGLAKEYHKLVRDIECHLPDQLPKSGVRLASAASRKISQYRQHDSDLELLKVEETSSLTICFVQLFRQRMYYEQLGIPLTPLELIYMADYDREWRRDQSHKLAIKPLMSQSDQGHGDGNQTLMEDWMEAASTEREQQTQEYSSHEELAQFDSRCVCCQAEQKQLLNSLPLPPPLREAQSTPAPASLRPTAKEHAYGYSHRCETAAQAARLDNPVKSYALRRAPKVTNLPDQVVCCSRGDQDQVKERTFGQPLGDNLKVLCTARVSSNRNRSLESESQAQFNTESKQSSSSASDMTVASIDTLNEVWYNPYAHHNPHCPIPAEFEAIDALQTGHKGAPVLDADAAHMRLQRTQYLASRYAMLSPEQRAREIAQRLRHLRLFQDRSNRKFYKQPLVDGRNGRKVRRGGDCFDCPMHLGLCPRLRNESLLAHFIESHLNMPGLQLNEIGEHTKQLIKFRPSTFERSRNICMSIAVLDGFKELPPPLTTIYNEGLAESMPKFATYLPFLVMARRIWLNAADTGETSQSKESFENAMALWIVGVDLPWTIYAHMTVFNHRIDISRSAVVKVRGLSANHNAEQFMAKSRNFLRLNGQELRLLTNNYNEPIYLEVSFRQFALPDRI